MIALDKENRDFTCVLQIGNEREKDKAKEKGSESLPSESHGEFADHGKISQTAFREFLRSKFGRLPDRGVRGRQQKRGGRHPTVFTNRKTGCFINGLEGHFARYCAEQFC